MVEDGVIAVVVLGLGEGLVDGLEGVVAGAVSGVDCAWGKERRLYHEMRWDNLSWNRAYS